MPDIFDTLEATPKRDVFDTIAPDISATVSLGKPGVDIPGTTYVPSPVDHFQDAGTGLPAGLSLRQQRSLEIGSAMMAAKAEQQNAPAWYRHIGPEILKSFEATPEQLQQEADNLQQTKRFGQQIGALPAEYNPIPKAPAAASSLAPVPSITGTVTPKAEIPEALVAGAALQNELLRNGGELVSPESLLIMGMTAGAGAVPKFGQTIQRLAAGYFGIEGARGVVEGYREYQEAKTPEEKQKAIAHVLSGAAIAIPAGSHAISPRIAVPGRPEPTIIRDVPPVEKSAEATPPPISADIPQQLERPIEPPTTAANSGSDLPANVSNATAEEAAPATPLGVTETPANLAANAPANTPMNPVRENGARTSIVLPDGTAIVGGRFHGETLQQAIEQGLATEAELVNGKAAFTKPDGTTWDLQGNPIQIKSSKNLSEASAGEKALAVRQAETAGRNERNSPPSDKTGEGTRETAIPTTEPAVAKPATVADAATDTPTPDPKEHIPMGAATPADIPETGVPENETHGIAARVREQRRLQGVTGPVEPGQGIGAEESVEHGRELLAAGRDPEAALTAFEKTKALSAEDIAVVRAHSETLAKAAREAAAKYGVNSPEYEAAWEKGFAWDKRTKPMQTEWHKIGMAQQGEVEIDTGTFHGLRRAFNEATGKDFTPGQAETAKDKATKVTKADQDATAAKTHLYNELDRQASASDAETKAIEAANRTVREAAARAADDVTKARTREAAARAELDRLRKAPDTAAESAASKTVREAAARAAKLEAQARERGITDQREIENIRNAPETAAERAANKTVREAAARAAKAERIAAIKKAVLEKKAAEAARKVAERKAEKANADVRAAAIKAAKAAAKARVDKADLSTHVWTKAREYIENGMDDFNDIRHKLAAELGMPVEKVTAAMGRTKRAKYLADEVWRKQQLARDLKSQAKRWLTDISTPGLSRALKAVPNVLFGLKVFGHGTVALGTHAPMVFFQPRFWATYARDFGKMYKMVGSKAYYERQVQDLVRRKNYTTARRAGLVNDPFTYEDYNSPDTTKYFGNISGMGNRGYSVLKILRQDMFDQHWSKLPRTMQIPEMAEAIANDVNHATGVVKGKAPPGSSIALFAPRLMASRAMWLVGDPAKAVGTFANWKNATQGEQWAAMAQVKEKAWVAATFFGLLALNQGILSAAGSKQKINGVPKAMGGGGLDPMESDFLKFKAAGLDFAYGSAMLNMAKLPPRIATAIAFEGKTSKLILEDERVYKIAGEFLRSQMSPFAGTATDLALGRDYAERPLPRAGFGLLPGRTDIPKRLKLHGITKPYTWAEYSSIQGTPIPISEGIREVWGQGFGMSNKQVDHYLKSLIIISIMAGTGGRVTEDWKVKK